MADTGDQVFIGCPGLGQGGKPRLFFQQFHNFSFSHGLFLVQTDVGDTRQWEAYTGFASDARAAATAVEKTCIFYLRV